MNYIKFASIDDVDDIMKFINDYWKENHILSTDKKLFLYEYLDNNRVNFLISKDSSNNINAILGFIKSSNDKKDIWAAMWRALKSKKNPMLGIELLEHLRSSDDYGVLSCNGIGANTIGIYNYLKIYTNYLNHFVLINNNMRKYSIAKISNTKYFKSVNFLSNDRYSLKRIEEDDFDFDFEQFKEFIPYKDDNYFYKRFCLHPIYKYDIYGIFDQDKLISLLVTRVEEHNGARVLRIVEFIGIEESIQYVSKYLYEIITINNYEYIDFLNFGINEKTLKNAGFFILDHDSTELIIPNYFYPFIQKNVKINFFADTNAINKIRMNRADGDQDRPS